MEQPTYDERLGVPLRWWVQGTMMVASLWLAIVVAVEGPTAWVVTAVAMALLAAMFLSYGSARVSVSATHLRAGRAVVELEHVGSVRALDAEQTHRTAGREADVRAFLMTRPYLKRAVRVEITDPADPTPYWLVSSRRPDRLARSLEAALDTRRESAGDNPA